MYTRIESRFWQDEKIRTMSSDARLLMLYLLTSPHRNIIGFYFLPSPYACFDLGWDEERFRKGLGEPLRNGVIKYDPDTCVVLVNNYLKYNPLENPNQVKSAIERLNELPQTPLFQDFESVLERFTQPFMEPLRERLRERLCQPGYRIQDTGSEHRIQDQDPSLKRVHEGEIVRTSEGGTGETHTPTNESPQEERLSSDRCSEEHSPTDQRSERKKKIKYAEFVSMTNDEYSSLVARLGSEERTRRAIEILDNYKGAKGARYKSDYRAILNWVITRLEEEERKVKPQQQRIPRAFAGLMELAREEDIHDTQRGDCAGGLGNS